jgi:iron(III) transport system substrate-binding protein
MWVSHAAGLSTLAPRGDSSCVSRDICRRWLPAHCWHWALPALAQKTQLLVYTALETDQLKAYQEGFNKVHPDIDIKWVRDSTGVITAKLLAEKANPQADAVMGVAASSLALLDKNGMLEPYKPLNLDAIMSQYRDKKNPPAWFGMDVWGATVCFNTVEAKKKNIPKPETWKDLTKPAYKGQIVMPNPASSAAPASST